MNLMHVIGFNHLLILFIHVALIPVEFFSSPARFAKFSYERQSSDVRLAIFIGLSRY